MSRLTLNGSCYFSKDESGITLEYIEHSTYEMYNDVETTVDIDNLMASQIVRMLMPDVIFNEDRHLTDNALEAAYARTVLNLADITMKLCKAEDAIKKLEMRYPSSQLEISQNNRR